MEEREELVSNKILAAVKGFNYNKAINLIDDATENLEKITIRLNIWHQIDENKRKQSYHGILSRLEKCLHLKCTIYPEDLRNLEYNEQDQAFENLAQRFLSNKYHDIILDIIKYEQNEDVKHRKINKFIQHVDDDEYGLIKDILQDQQNSGHMNEYVNIILVRAAEKGSIEIVKLILQEYRGRVTQQSSAGALLEACKKNDTPIIKLLLDNGVDLNDPTRSTELLKEAGNRGNIEAIRLLVKEGIEFDHQLIEYIDRLLEIADEELKTKCQRIKDALENPQSGQSLDNLEDEKFENAILDAIKYGELGRAIFLIEAFQKSIASAEFAIVPLSFKCFAKILTSDYTRNKNLMRELIEVIKSSCSINFNDRDDYISYDNDAKARVISRVAIYDCLDQIEQFLKYEDSGEERSDIIEALKDVYLKPEQKYKLVEYILGIKENSPHVAKYVDAALVSAVERDHTDIANFIFEKYQDKITQGTKDKALQVAVFSRYGNYLSRTCNFAENIPIMCRLIAMGADRRAALKSMKTKAPYAKALLEMAIEEIMNPKDFTIKDFKRISDRIDDEGAPYFPQKTSGNMAIVAAPLVTTPIEYCTRTFITKQNHDNFKDFCLNNIYPQAISIPVALYVRDLSHSYDLPIVANQAISSVAMDILVDKSIFSLEYVLSTILSVPIWALNFVAVQLVGIKMNQHDMGVNDYPFKATLFLHAVPALTNAALELASMSIIGKPIEVVKADIVDYVSDGAHYAYDTIMGVCSSSDSGQ